MGLPLQGPLGTKRIQDTEPSLDDNQSLSLSKKHKELFAVSTTSNSNLFTYTYEAKQLNSLKIVRYAITNYPMKDIVDIKYDPEKLILIEEKIFQQAIGYLESEKIPSAEDAIKNCNPSTPMPNNVVLVDIFATKADEKSNYLTIKHNKDKPNFAEIHTICLWKKTNTQFMVIDSSSSDFSERLGNSLDLNQKTVAIVEHPELKFYETPEGRRSFSEKTSDKKSRDCIDIALKIGIVLNQGTFLYKNVFEIQHSINLLSNQSAVNPILGKTNDGTSIKHFQSAQISKRNIMINTFSLIPSVFKQFFDYNAWLEFTKLDNKKQNTILKTLTFFNKEGLLKFSVDKNTDINWYFTRLEELSKLYSPMMNLRSALQGSGVLPSSGELTLKLNSNFFNPKSKPNKGES